MKNILYSIGLLFSTILLAACGGNAENLKNGDSAPDFKLQDAFGKEFSLSTYKGKSPVVIYFYPKASTPGCTKQACSIRDGKEKLELNNIVVLGISTDGKESLKKFIDEQKLNFPLLSDETKRTSEDYGVLNKLGFASRITFIIDKEGKIAHIVKDVDVSNHAEQVLKLAQGLK